MLLERNSNAQQQLASPGLGGVAVVFSELTFKLCSFHVVVFGGLWVGVDRIPLRLCGPHFLVAHHDHIQHTDILKRKLILPKLAEANMRIPNHDAVAGLKITPQNLHQRGFTAAIGAN